MKSLDEARAVLRNGGTMADLAQAIGVVISDPTSSMDDLRLGLRHSGFVAEQAELAIERRRGSDAGIPISDNDDASAARNATSGPARR